MIKILVNGDAATENNGLVVVPTGSVFEIAISNRENFASVELTVGAQNLNVVLGPGVNTTGPFTLHQTETVSAVFTPSTNTKFSWTPTYNTGNHACTVTCRCIPVGGSIDTLLKNHNSPADIIPVSRYPPYVGMPASSSGSQYTFCKTWENQSCGTATMAAKQAIHNAIWASRVSFPLSRARSVSLTIRAN